MAVTVKEMLAAAEAAVPRVGAQEAKAMHGQPGVVFVDLREPPEVAASGKVPGALAIPRGLLEFRADPEGASREAAFGGAKTIVTYCASGGRAALAGKTLKDMGYADVRNLGGFKDWTEGGGPVEKAG